MLRHICVLWQRCSLMCKPQYALRKSSVTWCWGHMPAHTHTHMFENSDLFATYFTVCLLTHPASPDACCPIAYVRDKFHVMLVPVCHVLLLIIQRISLIGNKHTFPALWSWGARAYPSLSLYFCYNRCTSEYAFDGLKLYLHLLANSCNRLIHYLVER